MYIRVYLTLGVGDVGVVYILRLRISECASYLGLMMSRGEGGGSTAYLGFESPKTL